MACAARRLIWLHFRACASVESRTKTAGRTVPQPWKPKPPDLFLYRDARDGRAWARVAAPGPKLRHLWNRARIARSAAQTNKAAAQLVLRDTSSVRKHPFGDNALRRKLFSALLVGDDNQQPSRPLCFGLHANALHQSCDATKHRRSSK